MKVNIIIPDGHKLVKISDTIFRVVEDKSVLPTTWEEFCESNKIRKEECFINDEGSVLKYYHPHDTKFNDERDPDTDGNLIPNKEKAEAVLAFMKLLQLRDCYNGDWHPDWKNGLQYKYSFAPTVDMLNGKYGLCNQETRFSVEMFSFKSAELRDSFVENFKDLILKIMPLYE